MGTSTLDPHGIIADSPLQKLQSQFLDDAEVHLYIKRDDLIHPEFGGNKWRKLKYNLIHARQNGFDTLLTFGGAWSNHIHATASAGRQFGFNTIGIIRGEPHTPLNATLSFAEKCGMQLHYINRKLYRRKSEASFLRKLEQKFGNIYILPEGGSNDLAIKGCSEIVQEILDDSEETFDVICCASGTGATLAGLIVAINNQSITLDSRAIGFSALKGGEFLKSEVDNLLGNDQRNSNWHIETGFHFGGYARVNDELIRFIHEFRSQYNIPLDAVYTAKMFYGLFELIRNKSFKPETVIVAVHSGGLQGNKGFNLQIN